MPQHPAGAARPTPVAVVNGVAEKADLSLQCHFGHGREPAAAPRLPTPRERAVARWNALVHPHPQVIDEEREIAFGRRAGAKYEPSVSISFLCSASNYDNAGLPRQSQRHPLQRGQGANAAGVPCRSSESR